MQTTNKISKYKKRRQFGLNIILSVVSITVLVPFIAIALISFGKDMIVASGNFFPTQYTLANYISVLTEFRFTNWLWNSIYLAFGTMVISVCITTISVFALSRIRFYGKKNLFSAILLVQVFPLTLSMVSIYKIFSAFSLLDKIEGLMISNSVMATAGMVLLAKGYFDSIPFELDEAAKIDGAGFFALFLKIILPLVKPILAIIALQSFVLAYNEYVIASVVMTGGFKSMPLAVGLQSMIEGQYGINWSRYCAAAMMGSVPMVILFYSMQRYFIGGLSEGGVKQ
ncbi:MAG: sugar ABC transporter permease [Saccharofermentanales bacterium]